jgi:hypothetical protein
MLICLPWIASSSRTFWILGLRVFSTETTQPVQAPADNQISGTSAVDGTPEPAKALSIRGKPRNKRLRAAVDPADSFKKSRRDISLLLMVIHL